MGRSAKLLAAAAAARLLAVPRLFCIDLAQPPFTAILPSELRCVSRSVLPVHRTALPQLNATLHSLAAAARRRGAAHHALAAIAHLGERGG